MSSRARESHPARISVIFDTDIGTDIDDTWALAMLLGCPELGLRLVVTSSGDTTYRARIAAGILAAGGRDDVPIGVGVPTELSLPPELALLERSQITFADEIDLEAYAGEVYADGVTALVDCVMNSPEPVTIVAIGPMTNIAAALAREPQIAARCRLVAMLGSIRCGGIHSKDPVAEYNVVRDVDACRSVFAADWNVTLTPLDTCGSIFFEGERYASIRKSTSPLLVDVIRNYELWSNVVGWKSFADRTTVLFDTVAVYLAYDESLLEIERLPIKVEDDGRTTIAIGSRELRVATSWRDRHTFTDHIVERLTGGVAK